MPGAPTAAISQLKRFLADADPERVTTAQAVALVGTFSAIERLASAGKLLFAARAAESSVWLDEGHAAPASWLAEKTKAPLGEAISTLETSRRLVELDDTADALRAGLLSQAQAREVARAAEKDPAAQGELLHVAEHGTFRQLRDKARQVLAAASSRQEEAARYRAIHDGRSLRHFTDAEGAFCLSARTTPDAGARLLAGIQAEADVLFEEARKAGVEDRPEAYRVDALVALVTGESRTATPTGVAEAETGADTEGRRRTDMVVRIDAEALQRGFAGAGETSEIAGVGPVPVATLKALLPDAWVKLLVLKGVDVLNVCHVGRNVTAHIESALQERDRCCVVPGCDVVHGLQAHHWPEDYVVSRTTNLAELARVCRRHHDMITYDGYVLRGGPGAWRFAMLEEHDTYFDTG